MIPGTPTSPKGAKIMTATAARNAASRLETAIRRIHEAETAHDNTQFIDTTAADKHAARADVWREKSFQAAAALDAEVGAGGWVWGSNDGHTNTVVFK